MKKSFLFACMAGALLFTSCGVVKTSKYTATTVPVETLISSVNVADLEVGNRVTFRYTTTAEDRRAGNDECIRAAIQAFLKANGNADVIVSPEYNYNSKVDYVEVSGRPAFYKNFKSNN